jgi:hypothetical protein
MLGKVFDQVLDVAHLPVFEVAGAQNVYGHGQVIAKLLTARAADNDNIQSGGRVFSTRRAKCQTN